MSLDMGLLLAGAKERGELETRVTNLIEETRTAGRELSNTFLQRQCSLFPYKHLHSPCFEIDEAVHGKACRMIVKPVLVVKTV